MRFLFTINKIILVASLILTHTSVFSQGGSTCASMQPICTDIGANFTAGTGTSSQSGPNYGCLSTQPNPSWYYFEIGANGDIDMNLYANEDIDYAIWGPFSSLADAQGRCGSGLGSTIDCSYSSTEDEYPSINGATIGQVYVMLITNYDNSVQDITLVQTGGSGATNCNIVYDCAINDFTANIGACNSATNTYDISGSVDFSYSPSLGDLIIEDCSGTQHVIGSAPFPNSAVLNYNITGLNADGSPCDLNIYFDSEPTCTDVINYTAPAPCNTTTCSISSITRNTGNCSAGNTYTLSGEVTYSDAPTSGTLTVSNSCGGSEVFTYPFPASPVPYSITGLTADGSSCDVTATFSATACTLSGNYTAPNVPNADAGPPEVLSCSAATVTLNGSSTTGSATYSWSGPGIVSGGNSTTPSVNATGSYTITVTDPANNCTSTANVNVTSDSSVPNVDAGTNQSLNCNVTTVNLNGASSTAGVTYSWSGPGIASGGSSASPTVNQAGTYTLTVTDPSNGCDAISTVDVTQNITPPNSDAGTDQVLSCAAASVNLNGASSTGGATFSWSGPGIVSGGSSASPSVNAAGLYTLTVTDPINNCTSTSNVNVTSDSSVPNVDAGLTQSLSCDVTAVDLDGASSTAGVSFSWTGPGIISGGNSASPAVDQPGTYTLTVTDPSNGCDAVSTVDITQNITPPNADAGTDQILSCLAASVNLNGASSTGGATFSWSGPGIISGGSSASPSVNQAGAYTLTVTDPANGCTATSSTNVTNDIGVPNVSAGSPQALDCSTTSVVLGGSSSTLGVTFTWSGPGIVSGGNTETPTVDQAGTYTLVVNDATNGCSATATVDVSENITPPNADAGTDQVLDCINTSAVLNGSSSTPGVTLSWAGPGIVSGGNTATPTIDQSGVYTLTVVDPTNSCTSTSTVNITEDITIPTVDFTADSMYGCGSVPVNFQETSGQIGMEYEWDFGNGNTSNSGSSVSEFYDQVGCYNVSLTITDPINKCSNSVMYPSLICVVAEPNASFTANPSVLESIAGLVNTTNESTNSTGYEWNFGDGSPTSDAINPSHDYTGLIGNYTIQLVATNQGICFDTAWYQINVKESLIFYVPNAFTPDGDSYNQEFKAIFTSGYDPQNFTMLIFNRWGEIIWESHNFDIGWNGTYGGRLVPDGIYTWKIEVKTNENDERKMYSGHVNVIR